MARETRLGQTITTWAFCAALIMSVVPAPLQAATPDSFVTMLGEAGHWVAGGQDQYFHSGNGSITLNGNPGYLSVGVSGGNLGDYYTLVFAAPPGQQLQVGEYERAQRAPFRQAGRPGIDIYGSGRGCNTVSGRFRVKDIATNQDGAVTRLWIVYEHHCEGSRPALIGEVRYAIPGPGGTLAVGPTELRWPDVDPGASTKLAPITVVNRSPGVTTVGTPSLSGSPDFTIASDQCAGSSLVTNGACRVWIRYRPAGPGVKAATLSIPEPGVTHTVGLEAFAFGGVTDLAMVLDPSPYTAGETFSHTPSDAFFHASGSPTRLTASIDGHDGGYLDLAFKAPSGDILRRNTTYENAKDYWFSGSAAGISVEGSDLSSCYGNGGEFTIGDFALNQFDEVQRAEVSFVVYCSLERALHGTFRFRAAGPNPVSLSYAGDGSIVYDEVEGLEARLSDPATGEGVAGETVDFRVLKNGGIVRMLSAVTDEDGVASAPFHAGFDPGAYAVQLAFSGNETYRVAAAASAFEIEKRPTALTYTGPPSATAGLDVALSAILTDEITGAPLPDRSVRFSLVRSGDEAAEVEVTTDEEGVATAVVPAPSKGPYDVKLEFDGAERRAGAALSSPFESVPRTTSVAYDGETQAPYRAPLQARAVLYDETLGEPVAGVPIRFSVDGGPGVAATTDADGVALASIDVDLPPGDHTIRTMFEGDGLRDAASMEAELTIVKAATELVGLGPEAGQKGTEVTLVANLVDGRDAPVEGRVVRFELGEIEVEATTDAAGRASEQVMLDEDFGAYELRASFSGGERYGSSTALLPFDIEWERTYVDVGDDSREVLLHPPTRELRFRATGDDTGWFQIPDMETVVLADGTEVVVVRYVEDDVAVVGKFVRGASAFASFVKTEDGAYTLLGP